MRVQVGQQELNRVLAEFGPAMIHERVDYGEGSAGS